VFAPVQEYLNFWRRVQLVITSIHSADYICHNEEALRPYSGIRQGRIEIGFFRKKYQLLRSGDDKSG
jgi:hypothetical protein